MDTKKFTPEVKNSTLDGLSAFCEDQTKFGTCYSDGCEFCAIHNAIEAIRNTEKNNRIKRAVSCLIDNGVDEDEAETVLQALGYILMDEELFPEE